MCASGEEHETKRADTIKYNMRTRLHFQWFMHAADVLQAAAYSSIAPMFARAFHNEPQAAANGVKTIQLQIKIKK